jgi:hypothetical protein
LVWLIVGFVLLAAFGPIMWLRPSRRDRLQARLRDEARRGGLVVEIVKIPKNNPSPNDRVSPGGIVREPIIICSAYRILARQRYKKTPTWFLLRGNDGDNVSNDLLGWVQHAKIPVLGLPPDPVGYWSGIGKIVHGLEDHCVAIEASSSALSWYWLENIGEREPADLVAEIAQRLNMMETLQGRAAEANREIQNREE